MNNLEFYESMFSCGGSEFYSRNEFECDQFLKNLGIDSNGSEAGIELFEYLYLNNIHYNEFLKLIDRFKSIFTEKFMISRVIINVLQKLGLNFEDNLKLIIKNILNELKNDEKLQKNYDIKNFNDYNDLVNSEDGNFYLYCKLSDNSFINYLK